MHHVMHHVMQVRIEHAFNSPENLTQCAEFLRKQIGQMNAQAAVVVTPKSKARLTTDYLL